MVTQEQIRHLAIARQISWCAMDECDLTFQGEEIALEIEFEAFIGSLPPDQKEAAEVLLLEDVIQITKSYGAEERRGKPHFWLNVNDVFVPAADAEDLDSVDLPEILKAYRLFDWSGVVAWVAVKRDQKPLSPVRNNAAKEAEAISVIKSWRNQ